jgi:exodeoxyribonuclease VII large subunit
LSALRFRAVSLIRGRLDRPRRSIDNAEAKLSQLNPRLVLTRGYAIVLDETGAIVRGAASAHTGSTVRLMFAEDAVKALVTESPAE